MTGERVIKIAAMVAAAVLAIAVLILDGEIELSLFMAVAVITSLAAFDAALDRQAAAPWPWLLVVAAILGGSVPRVVSRLADQTGVGAERAAHVSSVLFGGCVAAAMLLVARPPRGADQRDPVTGVLLLAPLITGFAGAAAAHAGPGRLGSAGSARLFEALGWASAGAVLVAAVLAVVLMRHPTRGLALFALAALVNALLVVRRAAGNDDDLGWLAIVSALLVVAPLVAPPARLGQDGGWRVSPAPAIVAVVLAVLAAQTSIVALNDDDAWRPGAFALGGLAVPALALGAIAVGRGRRAADDDDHDGRAIVFDMIAGSQLDVDEVAATLSDPWPETLPPSTTADASPVAAAFRRASGIATDPSPPEEREDHLEREPELGGAHAVLAGPADQSADHEGLVTAPEAEHLPPHLVDPSTGLRSAVGLQRSLVDAFGRRREAGEVSILMVALRNLDAIERAHGRVVLSQAVAAIAERFAGPLPDASVARFATDGFAALLDGPAIESVPLVDRCTEVLLDLLDPVPIGDEMIEIDVAAGVAQCYAGEDVAAFVRRANEALERAVRSPEPTLVAMP